MNEQGKCRYPDQGRMLAAYEMGLLDRSERTAFESHLEECPACLEQIFELAAVTTVMREDPGELASELAVTGAGKPAPQREGRRGRLLSWLQDRLDLLSRPRYFMPVGAAAAALLALLLLLPLGGDDDLRKLARFDPVAYVQIDTRSGAQTDATVAFDRGMGRYVAGDYGDAVGELSRAVQLGRELPAWRERDQAHFFLGLSQLLEDDPVAAVENLRIAAASSVRPVAERASWFLAQSYLVMNDAGKARAQLQDVSRQGLVFRERAAEQLAELERIIDE